MGYLDNAPPVLIALHKRLRSRFKNVLGELLCDSRMERAWTEIKKHLDSGSMTRTLTVTTNKAISTATLDDYHAGYIDEASIASRHLYLEAHYEDLWEEITVAASNSGLMRNLWVKDTSSKQISSRPRVTSRTRYNELLQIKKAAEHLAALITDSQLHRLIFEFFPDATAIALFKEPKWNRLKQDLRWDAAARLLPLPKWQSTPAFLMSIAQHAQRCANDERAKKLVRDTRDREYNHFVRHMHSYFKKNFDRPLIGVLARIASVLFRTELDSEAAKEKVKQALRYEKSKGVHKTP